MAGAKTKGTTQNKQFRKFRKYPNYAILGWGMVKSSSLGPANSKQAIILLMTANQGGLKERRLHDQQVLCGSVQISGKKKGKRAGRAARRLTTAMHQMQTGSQEGHQKMSTLFLAS